MPARTHSPGSPDSIPSPDLPPGLPPARWGVAVFTLIASVLVGGLGFWTLGPHPYLSEATTGDAALAADVRRAAGDGAGLQRLSVARVEGDRVTFAGVGDEGGDIGAPSPDTVFELGSVTKLWTGMLLADAVDRKEMALDAPISTYLPELAGTAAGKATPRQLATHTSGLPSLPPNMGVAGVWNVKRGGDVYAGWTTQRVIDAARATPTTDVGTRVYSNLGVSLLGHAEARAAKAASWQDLVEQRILTPLGMTHTTFAGTDPADMALPHRASGTPSSTWTGDGFSPAGTSTRTTATDMATFVRAVLASKAPGMTALDPIAAAGEHRRQGLNWLVETDQPTPTHWHNGATGGSSSMLALDRSAGRAAVVLGNSDVAVEPIGFALVHPGSGQTQKPVELDFETLAPLLFGALMAATVWWYALRGHTRTSLLTGVLSAVIGVIVTYVWGPWHTALGYACGVVLAALLLACILSALRFRSLPWTGRGRISDVGNLAFTVVVLIVTGAALIV